MRRGIALITVLWILVILFVLGAAISSIAVSHATFTLGAESDAAALAAAQTGLTRAMAVAKTVPTWNDAINGLSNALTTANLTVNNYYDPNNLHVYFVVSLDASSTPTQNRALVHSTGAVTSGTSGSGQVLRRKQVNAFIHQEFPLSAQSAFFALGCVTTSGNPSLNCDPAASPPGDPGYIVSRGAGCPGGLGLGASCAEEIPPPNPPLWPFPKMNEALVTQVAEGNTQVQFGSPQSFVTRTGHHFKVNPGAPSSFNLADLIDWSAPVCGAQTGMVGTNFIDVDPSVPGLEFKMTGTTQSAANPCGSPPTYSGSGPNVLVVRNANVTILGSAQYHGVLIVYNGSVELGGSLGIDGAVFASNGWIHGAAGITATHNQAYVNALGALNLWQPIIVTDSVWMGPEGAATP